MRQIETREGLYFEEAAVKVADFVIEHLPEKSFLKAIAQEKRKTTFSIGNKRWTLITSDDEISALTGNGYQKIIHIVLSNEGNDGKMLRFGIFTEPDFGLVLGANLGGGMFAHFKEPFDLARKMRTAKSEEKEKIRESLEKTHSPAKTATQLNVRRDRVSGIAAKLHI